MPHRPSDTVPTSAIGNMVATARRVMGKMKADRVSVAAGALAYRWFLSIFPLLIALLGIASLVTIPHHVLVTLIHGITVSLPSGAATVVSQSLTNAQGHANEGLLATAVAIVIALWSATSGMVVVEESLDMAFDLPKDRGFLERRLVALRLLAGSVVFGGAASVLTIFGSQLGGSLRHVAPIQGSLFTLTWDAIRWSVALSLINLLMSLFYFLAPNRESPWRWTSPGTVVATLTWAVVSLGFSFYTSKFGSFGVTYGAYAGVAILIFWLYLSGLAILLGAEVDAVLEIPTSEN